MRRTIFLFLFPVLVFFILACALLDGTPPAPVNTPTKLAVIIPYSNQTARAMPPTRTATPAPVKSTPEVFPPWVAEFSEPILRFVETQHPVFQDDFPAICVADEPEKPQQKLKVCSTPERRLYYQDDIWSLPVTARPTLDLQPDLQNDYALFNSGWFFDVPGSARTPHYAYIDSGVLVLKLPEGKEQKDLRVYNTHLMSRNFVLQFDLEFEDTQPQDTFRFQFEQGQTERFAFELVKEKTWTFRWGVGADEQARTGTYEYFSIPRVRVLIIARDTTCAVYLNNAPRAYFENCRVDPNQKITQKSATFHVLAEPGNPSVMTIDNVTMWDLDKNRP